VFNKGSFCKVGVELKEITQNGMVPQGWEAYESSCFEKAAVGFCVANGQALQPSREKTGVVTI
jgi:hypothetical protein